LSVLVVAGFVLAPATPLSRAVGWRPLAWMGRQWSYGFYLWHWPVIVLFNRVAGSHHTWLAFATTLVAAIASWWFVERRFRRRPATRVAARAVPATA
jgi:peptidoglycan/LPS O-acetylase OafA/YrhL